MKPVGKTMKRNRYVAPILDASMTLTLLLLMVYSLIGESVHEVLGTLMLVFLVVHHVWNIRWSRSVLRGKYTVYRYGKTLLVLLCLTTILGSAVSGVILSKHLFTWLPLETGRSLARTIHLFCAYWGFMFMSLHLGLHCGVLFAGLRERYLKNSMKLKWLVRIIICAMAVYGGYAFFERNLPNYMTLKVRFVFFDFNEPVIIFIADYFCIMILYCAMGNYIFQGIRRLTTRRNTKSTDT